MVGPQGFFQTLKTRAANSAVRSPIWLKFDLVRAFTVFLVTCKNEKDPIKSEGTRVLTSLYVIVDYSDAQGQLTLQSVVESCQNSNSYKLLCMSSLPASMKKIQSRVATTFLQLLVLGDFSRRSMAANSAVHDRSWLKFKLI